MHSKALTLAIVLVGSALGLAQGRDPVSYSLTKETTFEQGCFEPCACPIFFTSDVEGGFTLTLSDENPLFATYEVTDFVATVSMGGSNMVYTGKGVYTVGGEVALTHRLELDLQGPDGVTSHYDSGMVPGGGEFPAISIDISINGMFCFDTVFGIAAAPDKETGPPVTYRLQPGSTFQEGCFLFCDCALFEPQTLRGSFVLTPVSHTFPITEFDVSNVRFSTLVQGVPTMMRGGGTYTISGDFTLTHRLELDLKIGNGEIQHFDSENVIGGFDFPTIDIVVDLFDQVCFDNVLHIVAKPAE